MRRIVRISTTLAIVIAAYWTYALAVVPQIEPPVRPRVSGSASAAPLPPIDRLVGLREMFRPGDWELDPKTIVLESEQVKFLVQDYADASESPTLELDKCTIIFTPNGAARNEAERAAQAIILRAEKGASLEFDQPFDLRLGTIGRLVSGRLNGQIVIRSQGKSPGPEDDLYAVTGDIQLTEQRVWTTKPIEFSLGRSTGRGSEIEVRFAPGDAMGGKDHGLNIAGIDWIEIRHVERLHMEPAATKAGAKTPAPAGPVQRASDLPIELTCRGPFRFDFGQQKATFEDHVDVFRIHPDGPSDQVNGDRLTIQFAPRRQAAAPPAGASLDAAPKERAGLPDLEIRSVVVQGNPVIVRAPGQQVEARGERLLYDLPKNCIVLDGGPEVSLKQAANEIYARSVKYTIGEAGRLGEALAEGPGRLRGRMSGAMTQPLEARWKDHLRIWPDQRNQNLISLVGDAEMNYGVLGRLQAAKIHFWLNEVASDPASSGEAAPRATIQLDRMLACERVQLHAAQLNGKVNQLEVWFESSPGAAPGRPAPRGQSASRKAARTGDDRLVGGAPAASSEPQRNPAIQLARQFPRMARTAWRLATDDDPLTGLLISQAGASMVAGQAAAGAGSGGAPVNSVALGRQFQVEGSLLRARVAGLGERAEISELIVEGNVRFVETQTAQAGEKPVAVTGDRIHVVDAGKPHAAVGVAGNPAKFEGRGLTLVGSNINLNAGTNRLWIDGLGRLEVLMDRDLEGRPITKVGSETQPTGRLVVQWQQRMTLDGRTVRFDESVIATAGQQQLRTETMEVAFRDEIRFSDPKQASKPEVERLDCRGRVLLEGRETDAAGQASIQRIDVMDLSLNRTTGVVGASGPGRVISVRRQSAQMPPLVSAGLARPRAENAGAAEAAKPLVYLDVQFQRGLTGNLIQRQMAFHEQVRCIYVPVDSWDAKFDDDSPEALGPHGIALRCDRLTASQFPVPGSTQRAWGLDASGNTRAEGQAFTAQGTRMTYDQTKKLLILEGDGRSDATLYLDQPGKGRTAQRFRKILYWPETRAFKGEDFGSMQIILPGGANGGNGRTPGRQ